MTKFVTSCRKNYLDTIKNEQVMNFRVTGNFGYGTVFSVMKNLSLFGLRNEPSTEVFRAESKLEL